MPELPEVETLKRGLQHFIVGHKIEDVEVKKQRIFSGDPKKIIGSKIKDVKRFGKGLVIDLNNNLSLAIHIKLTGQLIYRGKDEPKTVNVDMTRVGKTLPNNWTHVIFHLDRGATLYYNDIRQFGWIKIIESSKLRELSFFKELGPEFPLVKNDNPLSEKMFAEVLSKSKLAIKPLIMDQKKMAGIGNIYANDGLYDAKINPKRPANSLSPTEAKTLYESLLTVLKKGLEQGGASELTFVNALGEKGHYQDHSLVYAHKGEKCKRDGGTILKTVIGGRGTFYCPKCQK